MKRLKGESSNWINSENLTKTKFRWQRGYGAFSVSSSIVPIVNHYIRSQDIHHKEKTYEQEFQGMVNKISNQP